MPILALALLAASPDPAAFPERLPGLMAACLEDAAGAGDVTDTEDSHKYICAGDPAVRLWAFLEQAKVSSYEQDTPQGRWLSREFPLGGCFKRIQMPDGKQASSGLSCTIWVPRPVTGPIAARP